MSLPRIALTMGDPAGIGPELAVKAAAAPEFARLATITVYGCPDIIANAAKKFLDTETINIRATGDLLLQEIIPGRENANCGLAAVNAVVTAAGDVLSGIADAMVTAPINKAAVNLAGIPFTGHTELIAELCGCTDFAMMQSAGNLRIAFVTTHIPLCEVSGAVTIKRITEVAGLLNAAAKADNIDHPKLAAAAVNPHAGENGYMGGEDEEIVKPALRRLREKGIDIDGPFPPDTLFIENTRNRYDGILAMYHDQGHIPFKMLAFDRGVNSTLGLPIIRTSPDHGTAFPIAWQGLADCGSMFAAVRLAIAMAGNRQGTRK